MNTLKISTEPDFIVMHPDSAKRMELALEDIKQGRMVILVDDEDRENEGDLTMAAEKITPEAINFMATFGKGLICLSLTDERVDALALPMMAQRNNSRFGTGFTVSIEAREGVSTGISAFDRAHTILTAINEHTVPSDLVTPGHIFPLRARNGGVLTRTGQTEGSVDLSRLGGLHPSGVICEVMNEDGSMARLPDLERFGARHKIRIVTVADIVRWRLVHEKGLEVVLDTLLPVANYGEFRLRVFRAKSHESLHLALTLGDLSGEPPLVRVQSACPVGDVFQSLLCDCASQLDASLAAIANEGRGALIYLHLSGLEQEQLISKIRGHTSSIESDISQEQSFHDCGIGAQILTELNVGKMRLLTNNMKKIVGLEAFGLRVLERIPIKKSGQSLNKLKTLIGNI